MRVRLILLLGILSASPVAQSQATPAEAKSADTARYQLYGGYSWLSNTFNGMPGYTKSLNGWDASITMAPIWRGLRFKADTFGYRGTNYGAKQDAYFITGGFQYDRRFGRETVFAEGLAGDLGIDQLWGPNAHPGMTASFATVLGGGLDTPISRRFAVRVSGDYIYQNLALIERVSYTQPYHLPGLPNNFARISTGVVWKF